MYLKNNKIRAEEIQSSLDEFAIVLTKNKNELAKIMDDAFAQYGIFIPQKFERTNLKPIYYSKQDFLSENIIINNQKLSYLEKVKLFSEFKRIKVLGNINQFERFPICKFILEIYRVVARGLNIDSFKTLINTHWYSNKVADSKYVEDFYKIQLYFEKLETIEQWKQQVIDLIDLKTKIHKEKNFEMHPLFVVSPDSLLYIRDYLN